MWYCQWTLKFSYQIKTIYNIFYWINLLETSVEIVQCQHGFSKKFYRSLKHQNLMSKVGKLDVFLDSLTFDFWMLNWLVETQMFEKGHFLIKKMWFDRLVVECRGMVYSATPSSSPVSPTLCWYLFSSKLLLKTWIFLKKLLRFKQV